VENNKYNAIQSVALHLLYLLSSFYDV